MVNRGKEWYHIRQVAERTGLSAQLIRKWEERYQAIQPHRLENGYRVYHEADVQRILQLKQLVDEGYSIKNAVIVLNGSPESEANIARQDVAKQPDEQPPVPKAKDDAWDFESATVVNHLVSLGSHGDTAKMVSELDRLVSVHGVYQVVYGIIVPFLRRVGSLWETGVWTEYQEHIASLLVRDFVVGLRSRVRTTPEGPLLLASCAPGERHEIMLQILLLEAAIRGWKTNFLGASPADHALADAVSQLQPDVVVVSITTDTPLVAYPNFVPELVELATNYPRVRFFLGGPKQIDVGLASALNRVVRIESAEELFAHVSHLELRDS